MLDKIDITLNDCELKFDLKVEGEFQGYASTFGGVDAYKDTIVEGAYKKTIKSNEELPMFINHASNEIPVGKWVRMVEDSKGLLAVGRINMKHKDGESLRSALEQKSMDGLSIGYRIPKGGSKEKEGGGRNLTEIDLKEISAVTFPADNAARISEVKQAIAEIESIKDAERILRDAGGFSRSSANEFISRFKHLLLSDLEAKQKEDNSSDGAEVLALIQKYSIG